ncbi:MAG TPA: O-antigen ligase domain-containing protein [Planctomycetaceae bacterium]|nr:O-antigen ligase domain-containing protein [Planctomycetaceae bacterium]
MRRRFATDRLFLGETSLAAPGGVGAIMRSGSVVPVTADVAARRRDLCLLYGRAGTSMVILSLLWSTMEALVAIAAVTALVWGAVLAVRGGLVAGSLVVLVAAAVFGYPFFHLQAGPVPLTADRVLWVLVLVQYVLWRRLGLADPKPLGGAEVAMGLFVGVLAASTFSHDWRIDGGQPAAWLGLFYVMPAGVYWVVRQAQLSERAVMGTFALLASLALYLAVTAVAEVRQLWWLVHPAYVRSAEYAEFFGRGRGPLLNPIGCGFFQGVGLCAGLMWWPRCRRAGKLGLAAFGLLICVGTFATLTRSVWMGTGLALVLLGALTIPRAWRLPVLAIVCVAAALTVATQWEHIMAFRRDRGLSARETASSVTLRPILARVAWNMFRDRPLFGCGFGQYRRASIDYLADRSTPLPLGKAKPFRQHNVFLSLVTETGVIGCGLFVAALLFWARDAWRLWQNRDAPSWARQYGLFFLGVLAVYLPNAMFHEVSIIPAFNLLFFLTAGMTSGLWMSVRPALRRAGSAEAGSLMRRTRHATA